MESFTVCCSINSLVPLSTRYVRVCHVTAVVTSQVAAWLGLQWARYRGQPLPLC